MAQIEIQEVSPAMNIHHVQSPKMDKLVDNHGIPQNIWLILYDFICFYMILHDFPQDCYESSSISGMEAA